MQYAQSETCSFQTNRDIAPPSAEHRQGIVWTDGVFSILYGQRPADQ